MVRLGLTRERASLSSDATAPMLAGGLGRVPGPAPATMALRTSPHHFSRFAHHELRNKIDQGWNLVRGKSFPAEQKDVVLNCARAQFAPAIRPALPNHVGDH